MVFKKKSNWTEEDKNVALNIHFNSPKGYNYLRNAMKLHIPSKASIIRWIPIKHFGVGFHKNYLRQFGDITSSMSLTCKEAIIIFDEISFRKDLKYNTFKDEISGVLDYEYKRTGKLAKEICVFIVRGLINNWKYVLSYFTSDTCIKADDLIKILRNNLDTAFDLGLNVRAIVCDQGPNNRKCLKLLGVKRQAPFFFRKTTTFTKKIYAIYDAVHITKSIRNMLMKYDFDTPDGIVSFKIIKSLYLHDSRNITRMCPKFTLKHINPNNFEKMRVRLATQVFSRTVGMAIKTLVDVRKFVPRKDCALATANFIKIDNLFDCFNSKKLFDKKKYKCALQKENLVQYNFANPDTRQSGHSSNPDTFYSSDNFKCSLYSPDNFFLRIEIRKNG